MRVRFTYFISLLRSWAVEERFLVRSKRVFTTDFFCCIGCSDLTLGYLSKWVGLWQTADNKWRFDERLINKPKTGRHSYFSCSIVNCTKLSIVFTRVKKRTSLIFWGSQMYHLHIFSTIVEGKGSQSAFSDDFYD